MFEYFEDAQKKISVLIKELGDATDVPFSAAVTWGNIKRRLLSYIYEGYIEFYGDNWQFSEFFEVYVSPYGCTLTTETTQGDLEAEIIKRYSESLEFDEKIEYYNKRKEFIKMKQQENEKNYIIRVIGDFKDGGELEDWGEMDFNSVEEAIKYLGMRRESIKEAEKALNGERDTFAGLVWKKISYRKGLK